MSVGTNVLHWRQNRRRCTGLKEGVMRKCRLPFAVAARHELPNELILANLAKDVSCKSLSMRQKPISPN